MKPTSMGKEGILNGMKTPREIQWGRGCLGCEGAFAQAAEEACGNAEEGAGGHAMYLPLDAPAVSQRSDTLTLIF